MSTQIYTTKLFEINKLREKLFFVFLSVLLIADMTQLFEQIYLIRFILIGGIPVLIFVLFRKYRIVFEGRVILYCYLALIIYSIPITVFYGGYESFMNLFKTYFRLFILFSLLLILQQQNLIMRAIKVPMILGLIFSIQALILNSMLYLGHTPQGELVYYPRLEITNLSYGILGYGTSWFEDDKGFKVIRAQSFFSEASRFSLFLEYSIFISIGLYSIYKKIGYLIIFIVCSLAFVMTFSHAGFFAVIGTAFIYLIHKYAKKASVESKGLIFLFGFVTIIGVMLGSLKLFTRLFEISDLGMISAAFGKSEGRLERSFELIESNLKIFKEYPFGIGLGLLQGTKGASTISVIEDASTFFSSSALFIWLTQTGIIGVGLLIFILLYIYKQIISRTMKKEPQSIACFLGLAFISQTMHHLFYGSWMDTMYLLIMALVIVTYRYN